MVVKKSNAIKSFENFNTIRKGKRHQILLRIRVVDSIVPDADKWMPGSDTRLIEHGSSITHRHDEEINRADFNCKN